jgi:hypothetical protein
MIRALLVMMAALAGCGTTASASPSPASISLTGDFTLTQSDPVEREYVNDRLVSCQGTNGYDDVGTGTAVVVRDADGTIVGTGRLVTEDAPRTSPTPHNCEWTFEVADLPDSTFYSVEVGDRGELTYSQAELEAMDWVVSATLGDE